MTLTTMYWLHVLSPTHVGTGRGVGYIDLPIHRDKVTGWPLIPGSSFKGVWADHHRATEAARTPGSDLALAFGRPSDVESNAGALIPTDARLICLPVRSFHGTFAWCTSALVLARLQRDLVLAGLTPPAIPTTDQAIVCTESTKLASSGRVYFEDLDFAAEPSPEATRWADVIAKAVFPDDSSWQTRFVERFAIVPDEIFNFLCEAGTEVVTRVRIDDDHGTVQEGQLWTEEALPAEAILAGMVVCDRVFSSQPSERTANDLMTTYASGAMPLQLGGKASVGRGRVRCVFGATRDRS